MLGNIGTAEILLLLFASVISLAVLVGVIALGVRLGMRGRDRRA